jgi:hypothetical protein
LLAKGIGLGLDLTKLEHTQCVPLALAGNLRLAESGHVRIPAKSSKTALIPSGKKCAELWCESTGQRLMFLAIAGCYEAAPLSRVCDVDCGAAAISC